MTFSLQLEGGACLLVKLNGFLVVVKLYIVSGCRFICRIPESTRFVHVPLRLEITVQHFQLVWYKLNGHTSLQSPSGSWLSIILMTNVSSQGFQNFALELKAWVEARC